MERSVLGLGETLAKEFGGSENVLLRKTGGKLKGKGNSVVSNGPPPTAVRAVLTDITNTHQPSQPSKFDGLQDDFGDLQKENLMLRKLLEERKSKQSRHRKAADKFAEIVHAEFSSCQVLFPNVEGS